MSYPPNPQAPYGQALYGQPSGQAPYGSQQYGPPLYQSPPPRGASSPEDLSLPLYGATPAQATKRFFAQYANFSGRASLSEYWWSALLTTVLMLVPTVLVMVGAIIVAVTAATASAQERGLSDDGAGYAQPDLAQGGAGVLLILGVVLLLVAWLGLLVPSLSITWRRLHDANFPGPFYFLTLVPSVGSIIILVLMLLPSKAEGQRFDRPAEVAAGR